MAEEKAPRRRRRWIMFAALVGAGGWYLRTRTAARPAAPVVPIPRPVAATPAGEPPAVLDLGRPNPSPVPTSRRPPPVAQAISPVETVAAGRTVVAPDLPGPVVVEPVVVEPVAAAEPAAAEPVAAAETPGVTGPRHMASADGAPEELSPVSEESASEPEQMVEPAVAEHETMVEEPVDEPGPVVQAPVVEPAAFSQEPVVATDPVIAEPVTEPTPTAPPAAAIDPTPAAEPDAGPAAEVAAGNTPARRPRPRPAPQPGRRPTPTPRGGTPAATQNAATQNGESRNGESRNGGSQHNGNGSAPARPAPQPSGFGPTGAAQTEPHALFTPAVPVEPSPETSDPTTPVRSDALQPPGADYTIKGSAGSMLFHTRDSPWYERTEAEVWFRTPEDAIAAGFTAWTTPADH